MGQPKLSITLLKDEKLGALALREAYHSKLNRILLITRCDDSLAWLPGEYGMNERSNRCERVVCDAADQGMSYSLRSGIEAAETEGADAVVVMLADQPFISAMMINRMIAAYGQQPELQYVASGDRGINKPPILWARSMFPILSQLQGDEGARSILLSPDYRGIRVEEPLAYRFQDADTFEDIINIKETLQNHRRAEGLK
jgi:molybdenum cofactor cytidylyltransferase